MKLKNKGRLRYQVLKYDKLTKVMTLRDPHTGKQFKIYDVGQLLKQAGYKVIK